MSDTTFLCKRELPHVFCKWMMWVSYCYGIFILLALFERVEYQKNYIFHRYLTYNIVNVKLKLCVVIQSFSKLFLGGLE